MSEDDFMDIIKSNNLEKYISDSDFWDISLKDMHIGLRDVSECVLFISDHITDAFFAKEREDEAPSLPLECVQALREFFDSADKFRDAMLNSILDDDDDEEYDFDDEEEDDDDC